MPELTPTGAVDVVERQVRRVRRRKNLYELQRTLYLAITAAAVAAALLLPLYYLADATITLLRRVANRERFWDAHRSHFYQRATDNGFSVREVVTCVFTLNLYLAGLAYASVAIASTAADAATLVLGALGVTAVLVRFSKVRTD